MQQRVITITGYALMMGILGFSFYNTGQSLASERRGDDEAEYYEYHDYDEKAGRKPAVAGDPAYAEECGGCHMAYPPGLLPARSWRKIMAGLDDHFGENAELDPGTRRDIEAYLVDASTAAPYRKLFRNLGGAAPPRITALPYFMRKHDGIPAKFVSGNEQVRSFSQCNACHRGAERGRFDEDDVFIAGVGRRDD